MRKIQRLFWRPDRVEHILKRHEVTPEEVEEALFDDSRGLLLKVGSAERNPEETVYRYLGRTAGGRYLFVALIYTGHGEALPLTARDMDGAERRRYSR
ncbi:MAG: BrnT family toxin [Acidimicrobiia bacterium]|jgi:uncharacterized DUF497 family protein|nr:BrnT family toxin [Acidimicrobiia bacterium]